PAGDRAPLGRALGADVDHACRAAIVDVAEPDRSGAAGAEPVRPHRWSAGRSVRITVTCASGPARSGASGTSMRQFASDIERRMPEPCGPVDRTVPATGS